MISSAVIRTCRSRGWWHCRLDRGHLGGRGEPLGELGPLGAPVVAAEAEVEIAQRTDDGDRADGEFALERLAFGRQRVEHAVDLLHLALGPVGPALVLGPQEAFVA